MNDDLTSKDSLDIFVSRRTMDVGVSERLMFRLEERGFKVRAQETGIEPGESFKVFMDDALRECCATVALITQPYLDSKWCRREAVAAFDNADHKLIPVVVDENCKPDGLVASFVYLDFAPVAEGDLDNVADKIARAIRTGRVLEDDPEFAPYLRHAAFVTNIIINEDLPFVGRGDEMADLDGRLQAGASAVAITAVSGMGGVGKSYLANHWAIDRRMNYRGVWVIRAENESTLIEDLAELAGEINKDYQSTNDPQTAARWVLKELGAMPGKRMLLIYDNAEKYRDIQHWLPKQGAHVLITSRQTNWAASGVNVMPLNVLTEAAAIELLQARAPHLGEDEARLVAERLGYLPLALSLAAARIGEDELTADQYLRDLTKHLKTETDESGQYSPDVTMNAAIAENLAQAAKKQPLAPALLHIPAYCASEDIPLELWDDLYPDESELSDPVARKRAFGELRKWSLISPGKSDNTINVHRLVQEVVRAQLDEDGQAKTAIGATLFALSTHYQGDPSDVRSWPVLSRLQSHAETAFSHFSDENAPDHAARLMNECGLYRKTRAEHGFAEPLYRRALAIDEASFGPDHPEVAIRLNNLAGLLQATNRLEEAEPLLSRALAIDEASYGPDHPEVAIDLNNLAGLLQATNRLEEAEPLYRRALAIDEASFGPDHPNVAIRLNNLALLLNATHRLDEAEPLIRRALAIDEASFGPDHPKVAIRLNNLAELLRVTHRLAEAEPLYRRALAIDEASLGPDHPNVARDLNNLAGLLRATNRLKEAEPLYRRSLAIDEASLGPDHPDVATLLNNLAGLLEVTNRLAEAEPLYRRALAIDEKSFGPDHPDVAIDLNNLAGLLEVTNRLEEAEPLYRRAAGIMLASLGPDHPNTITMSNNWLICWQELGL